MSGRSRNHGDNWWANYAPPGTVRCHATLQKGTQCGRIALDGSVVCTQHGGAAPQVQRRAAERVVMSADAAAAGLLALMEDQATPAQVRMKVMQDLLDRAGLAAAQTHRLVVTEEDPVEKLFSALLETPNGLNPPNPPQTPVAALESPENAADVVDAELVEDYDPVQDAMHRLEQSWTPDAAVLPLEPRHLGEVGPYAMDPPRGSASRRAPTRPQPGSDSVPRHIQDALDRLL